MYMPGNDVVTLTRDVEAVVIPAGETVTLPEGSIGYITQALGGSFTVVVEGGMFRIAGQDADALGKEPLAAPELPADAGQQDVENLVWEQLKTCYDPEIPINVVDLGLIYECRVESDGEGRRHARVAMTLTAPGCGMGEFLVADVREKLLMIPTIESADVELVFDPPWSQEMMSDAAKLQVGML